MHSLMLTLLELGHLTSKNLGFAYADQKTSYGEETITETNLLALRRRHPTQVNVFSFSKQKESHVTGADWEWHIVGKVLTLKLRVQAKRVTKRGTISKLDVRAPKAPSSQIDLLINDAVKYLMRPIYCFYCAEEHRSFWTSRPILHGMDSFEAGCLIVDAREIRKLTGLAVSLYHIEKRTVPWHYLVAGGLYASKNNPYERRFLDRPTYCQMLEIQNRSAERVDPQFERPQQSNFPTIADLNQPDRRDFDRTGVHETHARAFEQQIDYKELEERGIRRLVMIDARHLDPMELHFRDPR